MSSIEGREGNLVSTDEVSDMGLSKERESIRALLCGPKINSLVNALVKTQYSLFWNEFIAKPLSSGEIDESEAYKRFYGKLMKDYIEDVKKANGGLDNFRPTEKIRDIYLALSPFLDLQAFVDEALDYFLANGGDPGLFSFFNEMKASKLIQRVDAHLRKTIIDNKFVLRTFQGLKFLEKQGIQLKSWLQGIIDECISKADNYTAYRLRKELDGNGIISVPDGLILDLTEDKIVKCKKRYLRSIMTREHEKKYYGDPSVAIYRAGEFIKANPDVDFADEIEAVISDFLSEGNVDLIKSVIKYKLYSYDKLALVILERKTSPYYELHSQLQQRHEDYNSAQVIQLMLFKHSDFLSIKGGKILPQALELMTDHHLPLVWQHHLLSLDCSDEESQFDPELYLRKENTQKAEYLWPYLRRTALLTDEEKANYEKGAAIFGHRVMQIYTGIGTERRFHDCVQEMEGLISLYNQSGLNPDAFAGNILLQVAADEAKYGIDTSWLHMNKIIRELGQSDLVVQLREAKSTPTMEKIKSQIEMFNSVSDIFKSWKTLKHFFELIQVLKNKELAEKFEILRKEGESDPAKASLYNYVVTLGFNPNVALNKVLTFMDHPQQFLDSEARFTDQAIHENLSPGRYTEQPYLDLSARDMRDMLVEGKLDDIQTFFPKEMEFSMPIHAECFRLANLPIGDLIKEAVGSYKEGTKGKATQPKQIVLEVGSMLSKRRSGTPKDLLINLTNETLDPVLDQEEEVQIRNRVLFTKMGFGFKKGDDQLEKFRAMVTKKSDPLGVVAGNDMANCMPFGDGKTNQYTYSPSCGFFIVQRKNTEGEWRTISQSLLTENRKFSSAPNTVSGRSESELSAMVNMINAVHYRKKKIAEMLTDLDLSQDQLSYIVADSIEVANNFISTDPNTRNEKDQKNIEHLQKIYSQFFKAYLPELKREAAKQGVAINDKEILTTANLNFNPFNGLVRIPNNTMPITALSYLDNNLGASEVFPIESEEQDVEEKIHPENGVLPLTWRDAFQVALIQERAYSDNPSLDLGLPAMQNSLMAQSINNRHKNRPNMSLKYVDGSGLMRGYLNAYEGRSNERVSAFNEGSPMIYIEDLASDSINRVTGGKLILAFLERYEEEYLKKGNPIPIYGEFRDQTSYQIIEKNLSKIAKRLGKKIRRLDMRTYKHGQDLMHPIAFMVE